MPLNIVISIIIGQAKLNFRYLHKSPTFLNKNVNKDNKSGFS